MKLFLLIVFIFWFFTRSKECSSERLTYPLGPFGVCRFNVLVQPDQLVQSEFIEIRFVSRENRPFVDIFVFVFLSSTGGHILFLTLDF